eukprot:gene28711-31879_t
MLHGERDAQRCAFLANGHLGLHGIPRRPLGMTKQLEGGAMSESKLPLISQNNGQKCVRPSMLGTALKKARDITSMPWERPVKISDEQAKRESGTNALELRFPARRESLANNPNASQQDKSVNEAPEATELGAFSSKKPARMRRPQIVLPELDTSRLPRLPEVFTKDSPIPLLKKHATFKEQAVSQSAPNPFHKDPVEDNDVGRWVCQVNCETGEVVYHVASRLGLLGQL